MQNCLACCSFDLRFQYILSGWEGSISDSFLFHQARTTSLTIPPQKYFLADAGFGICDSLIVPYRGVRYHLREWGRAGERYVMMLVLIVYLFIFLDLKMQRNSSIYAMLQLAMLSSAFLAFSSEDFLLSFVHQNIAWLFRLVFQLL